MLARVRGSLLVFGLLVGWLSGQEPARAADDLKTVTWKIGEVTREAQVYAPPANGKLRPLVITFHGHGGGPRHVVRKFAFHEIWPEAVCVYPQGLPTPVPLIDPEGKRSGWQKYDGDQDNRDLELFDAILKTAIDEHQVDPQRVYIAGHSNGAFFAYLLAARRADKLAAIAPVAGNLSIRELRNQKPLPVIHVAGEQDRIVRFAGQERTMTQVRRINGCNAVGKAAGEFCTEYTSSDGPPLVTFIHPGGHEVPSGAPERIVEFFKKQALK